MIRHAYPYAAPSAGCVCTPQKCGGIIPDSDCPDHGAKKNPAMEWHQDGGPVCLDGQGARYRCDRGHPLPPAFTPSGDPDTWDDTCHCPEENRMDIDDTISDHHLPEDQDPAPEGETAPAARWDGVQDGPFSDTSPF